MFVVVTIFRPAVYKFAVLEATLAVLVTPISQPDVGPPLMAPARRHPVAGEICRAEVDMFWKPVILRNDVRIASVIYGFSNPPCPDFRGSGLHCGETTAPQKANLVFGNIIARLGETISIPTLSAVGHQRPVI